jgi:hypothetical protein
VELPDVEAERSRGRSRREEIPRTLLAELIDRDENYDAVQRLIDQGASRVPELVPVRYGRMLESPFAFFRGSALLMADDIAREASSKLDVQICGDAHLSNFGIFSSPERRLVFDVNDFDETTSGPFEFDVKRLAASSAIAGDSLGFTPQQQETAALSAVREYRSSLRVFAKQDFLDIWYATLDIDSLVSELRSYFSDEAMRQVGDVINRARGKNAQRAFSKLVNVIEGQPHIAHDPPLLVPLHTLLSDIDEVDADELLARVLDGYASTLTSDRQVVLRRRFTPIEAARKVGRSGISGNPMFHRSPAWSRQRRPIFPSDQRKPMSRSWTKPGA